MVSFIPFSRKRPASREAAREAAALHGVPAPVARVDVDDAEQQQLELARVDVGGRERALRHDLVEAAEERA